MWVVPVLLVVVVVVGLLVTEELVLAVVVSVFLGVILLVTTGGIMLPVVLFSLCSRGVVVKLLMAASRDCLFALFGGLGGWLDEYCDLDIRL